MQKDDSQRSYRESMSSFQNSDDDPKQNRIEQGAINLNNVKFEQHC